MGFFHYRSIESKDFSECDELSGKWKTVEPHLVAHTEINSTNYENSLANFIYIESKIDVSHSTFVAQPDNLLTGVVRVACDQRENIQFSSAICDRSTF